MQLRLIQISADYGNDGVELTFSQNLTPMHETLFLKDRKTFKLSKEEYDEIRPLEINMIYDVDLKIQKGEQ